MWSQIESISRNSDKREHTENEVKERGYCRSEHFIFAVSGVHWNEIRYMWDFSIIYNTNLLTNSGADFAVWSSF